MADEPDDNVTPAMREAGGNVLREFFPRINVDDAEDLAEGVWRAMAEATPDPDNAALEGSNGH